MKTRFLLCLLLWVISISSCDKIEGPYGNGPGSSDTTSSGYFKKVLVEDFTGHKCGNCPDAANKLKQIENQFGDKIVAMAVHAGFFAEPNASGLFVYDFRTTPGTELDQFFGNSAVGLPNGLINRKAFNGSPIVDRDAWLSKVSEIVNLPAEAWITMTPSYNASDRSLAVDINTKILSELNDSLQLAVYILEDSIVRPQIDYADPDGYVEDYTHRHVLRGSMNGTWGSGLAPGNSFTSGQEFDSQLSATLPANWVAEKVHLVAVLYRSSNKEVVQAESIHIIE